MVSAAKDEGHCCRRHVKGRRPLGRAAGPSVVSPPATQMFLRGARSSSRGHEIPDPGEMCEADHRLHVSAYVPPHSRAALAYRRPLPLGRREAARNLILQLVYSARPARSGAGRGRAVVHAKGLPARRQRTVRQRTARCAAAHAVLLGAAAAGRPGRRCLPPVGGALGALAAEQVLGHEVWDVSVGLALLGAAPHLPLRLVCAARQGVGSRGRVSEMAIARAEWGSRQAGA